jgi:hypothetical protein
VAEFLVPASIRVTSKTPRISGYYDALVEAEQRQRAAEAQLAELEAIVRSGERCGAFRREPSRLALSKRLRRMAVERLFAP